MLHVSKLARQVDKVS